VSNFTSKLSLLLVLAVYAIGATAQSVTDADAAIAEIGHRWAAATYATPEDAQVAAYQSVLDDASRTASTFPSRAEPRVWQAIILASLAHAQGGLGALGKVKQSRELLLEAEKIDAGVMDGSIYSTLGSLYAKVPGWPIGFGDRKKARAYLDKAIEIDSAGIDANYFYADFLVDQGEYAAAKAHLERALAAPPRPGRDDADQGRRAQAKAMLSMLREKHAGELAAN
jgi:tetratricopeptide (TPR) repeat protein